MRHIQEFIMSFNVKTLFQLLLIILVFPLSALPQSKCLKEVHEILYRYQKNSEIYNPSEDGDDETFHFEYIRFEMNDVKSSLLDSVMKYIVETDNKYIGEGRSLMNDENCKFIIDFFLPYAVKQESPTGIRVFEMPNSFFLNLTYDSGCSTDTFGFTNGKYQFLTSDFINSWFHKVEDISIMDIFQSWGEDFYSWWFEIYCGKIVQVHFVNGWCEPRVFDLINNREVYVIDYDYDLCKSNIQNFRQIDFINASY